MSDLTGMVVVSCAGLQQSSYSSDPHLLWRWNPCERSLVFHKNLGTNKIEQREKFFPVVLQRSPGDQ